MTHRPPAVLESIPDQVRFLRDPVECLIEHGTENDVTRMTVPAYGLSSTEYHVVSHPGYAADVLTDRDSFRQYSSVRHALPGVDQGFLSNRTGEWATRRAAFEGAFRGATFRSFLDALEDQLVRDVARLETGVDYRVDDLMRSLLIRATTRAVADRTPDPAVAARLSGAVDAALRKTSFGYGTVLPVWMPTPSFVSFWTRFRQLRGWARDLADGVPEDGVARAVHRELELPEEDLARIVQLLVVAGFVSPSVMVTNAVSLLVDNPEYVASLVEDLGGRRDAPRSYAEVRAGRPGLRWTLFESLRLYPPTFNLTRRVATPSARLGPYELEEDDLVWIDQWSLGRDDDYWAVPESFAPERWAGLSTDRPAFVPFGAGPRACFGRQVALLTGEILLANLLGRYRIEEAETSLSPSSVRGGASLSLDSPRICLSEPVAAPVSPGPRRDAEPAGEDRSTG